MPKEIVLDITTGIFVLGSVFGASHLKKLASTLRKLLDSDKRLTKASE